MVSDGDRTGSVSCVLFTLVLLGAAIAALSTVSLGFFVDSSVAVSFWPANALALAVLLRALDGQAVRAAGLATTLAVMVVVSLAFGRDPVIATGFAIGNVVEIAIAAWILRRATLPLSDTHGFARLILGGVLVGPLVSSLIAGAAMGLDRGAAAIMPAAAQWLVCDMLGMAVFAPVFLTWRRPGRSAGLPSPRLVSAVTAQALVVVTALLVFSQPDLAWLFAVFPLVILAVWSGREAGGAAAVALVAVVGALMTASGRGPLAAADTEATVILIQAFIAAQVLIVHPLALVLARLERQSRAAEAARARAERTSDSRAKLLAQVSHEIHSPLSGVLGLAELMQDGSLGAMTPAQKDVLAQIAACAAEMQGLAGDLLDAAAVQSGRLKVACGAVPASDLIDEAIMAARFRCKAYEPAIHRVGHPRPDLHVRADRQRLKQILVNLIVNGAKYGGRPPRIEVALVEKAGRVRIEVTDNGRGVPVELREALFTPFERLGAEQSQIEGAGLGLAVARELAEAQGARIGVEDGHLSGACFYVDLERARAEAAAA